MMILFPFKRHFSGSANRILLLDLAAYSMTRNRPGKMTVVGNGKLAYANGQTIAKQNTVSGKYPLSNSRQTKCIAS